MLPLGFVPNKQNYSLHTYIGIVIRGLTYVHTIYIHKYMEKTDLHVRVKTHVRIYALSPIIQNTKEVRFVHKGSRGKKKKGGGQDLTTFSKRTTLCT